MKKKKNGKILLETAIYYYFEKGIITMKKIISVVLIAAFLFANVVTLSAEYFDGDDIQEAFYANITFDDTIEWPNFLEARLDAYCYGGQTGMGHAVASVEYNQVMLDSDYDTGEFVTVWAHAGDFQHPENILFPDATKRRSLTSVVEFRWNDVILSEDVSD